MSFGDSGLIGNDGDAEAKVVEKTDGFRDAREELELRAGEGSVDDASVEMIDEGIYDAVAIE
jgi:hypothetical protein